MDIIKKYFPDLDDSKLKKLKQLKPLYLEWNSKINVISRKDTENFFERHILHSLSIAKIFSFKESTEIADFGSGGGLPGLPLSIIFPECNFYLFDSIAKKMKVVENISHKIGSENIAYLTERAEKTDRKFDFITGRAVTSLPQFMIWSKNKIKKKGTNSFPNGVIYLKGGDFEHELQMIKQNYKVYAIGDFLEEPFFQTKKIIHIF